MRFLAAAAILLLSGCATVRREPTSVDNGLLLLRARVRGAVIPFFSDAADSAIVDLIGPDGRPVPGRFAVAGVSASGLVAFLDLPPGRYALREITFKARGVRYASPLPSAMALKQAVTLRPGKAAFLGEIVLDGSFPEFDVAVERALAVVRHWLFPWSWRRRPVLPRDADLRSFDGSIAAEIRALRDARQLLDRTLWRPLLEDRLREIGAPAPAKTVGTIRKKELPLRPETKLSWRDTLEWGEPRRSGRGLGLVWRKPDSSAVAAIYFTSRTTPGFAGFSAAVRELRASAGSIEDPAALYEVRVGTTAGTAARSTTYRYPEGTLVGSETKVVVTETVLVDWGDGMYTARLRAERPEFEKLLSAFREFLLQLVLGAPVKEQPREAELPPL